jgi:hypothetical protein
MSHPDRWLLAVLDRALVCLAGVTLAPLPDGAKPVPLLGKLGYLALCGMLLAIGIGSCRLRENVALAERERAQQVEQWSADDAVPQPRLVFRPGAGCWPPSTSAQSG